MNGSCITPQPPPQQPPSQLFTCPDGSQIDLSLGQQCQPMSPPIKQMIHRSQIVKYIGGISLDVVIVN